MPASSLRQRRGRRDDEENVNNNNADNINEDDELELFAKHYKQATANNSISQCRTVLLIIIGITILASTLLISRYKSISQQTLFNNNNSNKAIKRQDLKLITIYPYQVTYQIHTLKSQTELLITDANRDAVNAIRITIGMSNNLQYNTNSTNKRRKKKKRGAVGILLGISNYIASLRSNVEEEEGYIPGNVILEAYDEVMIRNYLVEHGSRCLSNKEDTSSAENTILKRYDETSTLMQTITDDTDFLDTLWNHIIQLFTLCQFTNNDARGYIAFNTTISKSSIDTTEVSIQERLEESRLNGSVMVVKESEESYNDDTTTGDRDDRLHYTSLFVLPNEEAARMLQVSLLEEMSTLATTDRSPQSKLLLFEINDDQLKKMKLDESRQM